MQAQPYRKSSRRQQTTALQAMQRGHAAYMRNPMDTRRALMRRKKKRPANRHPLDIILGIRSGRS